MKLFAVVGLAMCLFAVSEACIGAALLAAKAAGS